MHGPLFDHAETAARLRDAGMHRAVSAQDAKVPGWSDLAYAAIVNIARRQSELHVDDVILEFQLPPVHSNAWGSVWQKAIRNGIIRHSGRVRACKVDPKKHAHLSPQYLSLIYARAA